MSNINIGDTVHVKFLSKAEEEALVKKLALANDVLNNHQWAEMHQDNQVPKNFDASKGFTS